MVNQRSSSPAPRRTLALVSAGAEVETRAGARVLALTTLALSGDLETTVSPLASTAALERHAAAVGRALAARRQRLQTLRRTIELAGLGAHAAASPLTALPRVLLLLDEALTSAARNARGVQRTR